MISQQAEISMWALADSSYSLFRVWKWFTSVHSRLKESFLCTGDPSSHSLMRLFVCLFVCVFASMCTGVTPSWGTRRCRRSPSRSQRSPTCQDTREAAAPGSRSPKDWRRFTLRSNKAWSESPAHWCTLKTSVLARPIKSSNHKRLSFSIHELKMLLSNDLFLR